jgi:hypothetical protein
MSRRDRNHVVDIPSPRSVRARIPYRRGAVFMEVGPWFVQQEIRTGRLPALKLCRHYTLLKEDLDTYLDGARDEVA